MQENIREYFQIREIRETFLPRMIPVIRYIMVLLLLDSVPGNKWLDHLISMNNRHVLPMLVSLLNTVCAYNPGGYGIP